MTGHHTSLMSLATGLASCCHSCEFSLFYIFLCWVTHEHTHTYIQTYAHTHTHTNMHTPTHMHTHTQLFPHMNLQMLSQDVDFLTCRTGAILVHYVRCTSFRSVQHYILLQFHIHIICLNYLITQEQNRCKICGTASVAMYVAKQHRTKLLLQPAGAQMHSCNCPECVNTWHFLTAQYQMLCEVKLFSQN